MAIPKITGAQRDFSAGELDVSMKRADESPVMKAGARQMSNWRILNSKIVKNRPGRVALFLEAGRTEEVLMSPGNIFYLVFGNGYLRVYNAAGAQVFNSTVKGDGAAAIPWTSATAGGVTYDINLLSIYIAYADGAPNNVPQILTWNGVSQTSNWTLSTFAETITAGGQKRTAFYRLSTQGVTMLPSATSGSITLIFSSAVAFAGQVGTRMRFCGRQVLITGYVSPTELNATVIEPLPPGQALTLTTDVGQFNIGDLIEGATSGAQGIVTQSPTQQNINFVPPIPSGLTFQIGDAVTGGTSTATGVVISVLKEEGEIEQITVSLDTSTAFSAAEVVTGPNGSATNTSVSGVDLTVQLLQLTSGIVQVFTSSEIVVGPSGSAKTTAAATEVPQAVTVWDDEVMNTYRGYPSSVFFDQDRLGLCNFPALLSGIAWSAIGLPTDFYVAALSDNAIFELAPGKMQVLFVVPGMESSEFVFCDKAVYYIPITASIPLEPGSVAFNLISEQGCMPNVRPRPCEQTIVYMKAGGAMVAAVQAPGAYYRPYTVDNISEFHSHLFTGSPAIAIAIPAATTQFEEFYIYIALANGTLVVGKYNIRNGLLEPGQDGKPAVGWAPWNGGGTVSWVAAQAADVIFTTAYAPNGIPAVSLVERLDNTQYLDSAMLVNSPPTPFAAPAGKGPLWWIPSGAVTLIDQVTRMMGTYQIDNQGNIIPQSNAGENLTSSQLVAGQPWTATLEPFVPDAAPGQSVHQRMFKRRVSRMAVYVSSSTGFLLARLFSGPLTRTSPALGTIMNTYRVETWNQDDDPTQPPPLREEAQRWRPIGRAYDPRVAVIKDTPGPLFVHEVGIECSI